MADILTDSRANGPGLRDVFWVQGCTVRCPGCQNPGLLARKRNRLVPVAGLLDALEQRVGEIEGITVSGGEPTEQAVGVAALAEGARALGMTTVIYTGYVYEDLVREGSAEVHRLLEATDLLIDGPFLVEQRTVNLPWRGSSNQRLMPLSGRIRTDTADDTSPVEELHLEASTGQHSIAHTGILDTIDLMATPLYGEETPRKPGGQ